MTPDSKTNPIDFTDFNSPNVLKVYSEYERRKRVLESTDMKVLVDSLRAADKDDYTDIIDDLLVSYKLKVPTMVCTQCGEVHPITDHHKSKTKFNTYNPLCKFCVSDNDSDRRKDFTERLKIKHSTIKSANNEMGFTTNFTVATFVDKMSVDPMYKYLMEEWDIHGKHDKSYAVQFSKLDRSKPFDFNNIYARTTYTIGKVFFQKTAKCKPTEYESFAHASASTGIPSLDIMKAAKKPSKLGWSFKASTPTFVQGDILALVEDKDSPLTE